MTYELTHGVSSQDVNIVDAVDRTIRVVVNGLSESFLKVMVVFIVGVIIGQVILALVLTYCYRLRKSLEPHNIIITIEDANKVIKAISVNPESGEAQNINGEVKDIMTNIDECVLQ